MYAPYRPIKTAKPFKNPYFSFFSSKIKANSGNTDLDESIRYYVWQRFIYSSAHFFPLRQLAKRQETKAVCTFFSVHSRNAREMHPFFQADTVSNHALNLHDCKEREKSIRIGGGAKLKLVDSACF